MNIPKEKQIKFIKKLIDETKKNNLNWQRMSENSVVVIDALGQRRNLDPEGIFWCEVETKKEKRNPLVICLAMTVKGIVDCSLSSDRSAYQNLDNTIDEVVVLLLRLWRIIFNRLPNVNKFIDEYIDEFLEDDD